MKSPGLLTRRRMLALGAAFIPAAGGLFRPAAVAAADRAPTPACGKDAQATPRSTEGPFYMPRSPRRDSFLEPGLKGERVALGGRILTRSCRPVPNAMVDLWHAEGNGEYDNQGFRCRGHVLTDADGRYRFLTVAPGDYPGRTRHYHVKVKAPERPVLTTQLYFPDAPGNARDFLFKPALLVRIEPAADGRVALFDFILDMA